MPGITREQAESLYDAIRLENRDQAMTAAESINPRLRADLEQNPQAVLDVTARMLRWPTWDVAPETFRRAEGPAESGVRAPTLMDIAGAVLPLGTAVAGEQLASRAAAPVLERALATAPRARLLAQRAIQGLGGAAGYQAPEMIRERSLAPLATPETALAAAAPLALTGARRLLPGGGAMRQAERLGGELQQFREGMAPVRHALGAGGPRVEMTPAVRGALETGGLTPPPGVTALKGRGIQQLEQAVTGAEREIGLGLRSARMTPAEAATSGTAAKDAVGDLLGELESIGKPIAGSKEALRAAQQASTEALTSLRRAQTSRLGIPGALPPGVAPENVIEQGGMLYAQVPMTGQWVRVGRAATPAAPPLNVAREIVETETTGPKGLTRTVRTIRGRK